MFDKDAARRAVISRHQRYATPSDKLGPTRRRVFQERMARIERMLREGRTYRDIAQELGVSYQRIQQIAKNNMPPELKRRRFTEKIEKPCKMCGTAMVIFKSQQKRVFCSRVCQQKWPKIPAWVQRENALARRRALYKKSPEFRRKSRAATKAYYESVKNEPWFKERGRKYVANYKARQKEKELVQKEELRKKLIQHGVIKG